MPTLLLARGASLEWGAARTLVMGVLNVTPDSFSDGGRHATTDAALAAALRLADEGADLIDIGGESSRPGAEPVDEAEELRRVLPVVERLADERPDILLSVDTAKPAVARRALEAGAHLINDITGGGETTSMYEAVAEAGAGYCLMHMQGAPRTMQRDPSYDDVVGEVGRFFEERLEALERAGVARPSIILDPGIGFGKRLAHNLALLRASGEFTRRFGCPVLIGVSRKSMLGELTGIAEPAARDRPTLSAHVAAVARGAAIVRTHDAAAAVESLRVADAILRPAS